MSQPPEDDCQMEASRAPENESKPRTIPPYEIFLLVIEAMVDNALAVTTSAHWLLEAHTMATSMLYIYLDMRPKMEHFRRHLNRHRDRYALFRSAMNTQINRDSRRIVENSFPRFPFRGAWSRHHADNESVWVCPKIDVFFLPPFGSPPVQPEDYINDERGRLARLNDVLGRREVFRNPKLAAAALFQHVRNIRISGICSVLIDYCPEEIRCIESLPALELIQISHRHMRFPTPPRNPEDRHRHAELIPIDESLYPYAAVAANLDPFGLEDLWGKLLKRGVRFELTGYAESDAEDMTPRNELVRTPEGPMMRFTDQECRCYLDPVETERKQMMEEMGFGSQWYVSLPRDMSSNDFIVCLQREGGT